MDLEVLAAASQAQPSSWSAWIPLLAAVVGFVGVLLALMQKWRNDLRDAWWKRTQWALDKTMDASADTGARVIGLTALRYMQRSDLATDSDREMLDKVADEILRGWQQP